MRRLPLPCLLLPFSLAACGDEASTADASSEEAKEDAGSGAAGAAGKKPVSAADAIDAPEGKWTFIPIAGSKCRDGSDTGIEVNLSSKSDDVMIYLEGGGACFNKATCAAGNPHDFEPTGFGRAGGLFNRTKDENPTRDWSYVYIPYCTGDVHSGDNQKGDPGIVDADGKPALQQYVGWGNVTRALERIVPAFPNAERVLLTGSSAGGFGAASNFDHVARAFDPIPVDMIDDSGPPMSSTYIAPCLQDAWRKLWNFDDTLLADCGKTCSKTDDYVMDLARFTATKYEKRYAGLVISYSDTVIRLFYGFGDNDCNVATLPSMDEKRFQKGLDEFRAEMKKDYPHFGTLYLPETSHTWIAKDELYTRKVAGVLMIDWVKGILDGKPTHVGP